jgi:hypothetical protein
MAYRVVASTSMSKLSPSAQAVLSAYNAGFDRPVAVHHKPRIAAALRAVANELGYRIIYDDYETEYRIDVADLLAIATELEAQ